MRKAPKKTIGNIILPVIVPDGTKPENFLSNDKAYKHVWQVLSALRSHDDSFNTMINQMEFNRRLPPKIIVTPPITPPNGRGNGEIGETSEIYQLELEFKELEKRYIDAIIPRIVEQCGDARYWSRWAQDIQEIAQNVIQRIRLLLQDDGRFAATFKKYHKGLHNTINPMVTEEQAMEMLAQHWITHPVFDALFEEYKFSEHNSVSRNIQRIFATLKERNVHQELSQLEEFYRDVAARAKGIDTLEGRQNIMHELYREFFSTAFKKDAERLGIVYTPAEVIDFILHSANDLLKKYFGRHLGAANVHILDPFAGTGSFVVRLLSDPKLISDKDLGYKYNNEIHFNEIMLLPYYIANVNIEQTFHSRFPQSSCQTFRNGVLCDTFQLHEERHQPDLMGALPVNAERAERQRKTYLLRSLSATLPIRRDNAAMATATLTLSTLIWMKTSLKLTPATAAAKIKNSLYDSYIRALRWASRRIGDEGMIAFVTNGNFIEGNAQQGVRHCLYQEFSHVYALNLRGNARTSGEVRRKEGGSVFADGTRVTATILILIKIKQEQPEAMRSSLL